METVFNQLKIEEGVYTLRKMCLNHLRLGSRNTGKIFPRGPYLREPSKNRSVVY